MFRMYDVDGNGVIDQDEMTKIVQAIYDMLGAGAVKPTDTAEERAKNIFNRLNIKKKKFKKIKKKFFLRVFFKIKTIKQTNNINRNTIKPIF